jgi:guanine deaminase
VITAHRGKIAHCLGDPDLDPANFQCFDDGVLLVDQGHIAAIGPANTMLENLSPDIQVIDHGDDLIVPGFIDCHVHYPQIDVIASYGTQLLEWLESYTFPAEAAFADPVHARASAEFFLDELLRNGTTSALVFATVHRESAEALFAASQQRQMRIATGKVLMDRHCPAYLQDTAQSAYAESRELLERWHGQDRLLYAITPRFAVTSSDEQLRLAGTLAAEFPDALIHTHLAENPDEVRWVRELFPHAASYLDVYQQAGLLRQRAVFAHCLHLHDEDYTSMASRGGGMAFCPTSNLFLGSGLFDLARAREHQISVGLGTDVGGGTCFSLLRTINEAYKVLQLNQQSLASTAALYLATLGAANTLGIDDKVGSLEPGKEADFVVLDHAATALVERRMQTAANIEDALFVHMVLGDDRSVRATYILGEEAHRKSGAAG